MNQENQELKSSNDVQVVDCEDTKVSLQKINDFGIKHRGIIMVVSALAIIVMVTFLILGWNNFQMNSCQICEKSGRECYEPNSSGAYTRQIGWQRIDNSYLNEIKEG